MSTRTFWRYLIAAALLTGITLVAYLSSGPLLADSDPWTKAQTVQTEDLVKELESTKTPPTVVFVGFSVFTPPGTSRARRIMALRAARKV